MWLSVEGLDGTGKTFFINKLKDIDLDTTVVKIGKPEGETIREIITASLKTETKFVANLLEVMQDLSIPKLILQDRGALTTSAYNLYLSTGDIELTHRILDHYNKIPKPDITFYITAALDTAMERLYARDFLSDKELEKEKSLFVGVAPYFDLLLKENKQFVIQLSGENK